MGQISKGENTFLRLVLRLFFFQVSVDVFKFLGLYASVIVGFALSFHVVYANHETIEYFVDPLTSILFTLAMMVGEFNFGDLFVPSQVILARSERRPVLEM